MCQHCLALLLPHQLIFHVSLAISVDKCFVPSDVLNEKAQSLGLNPSQIVQYGLPIRKGFWNKEGDGSSQQQGNKFMKFFGGGGGGASSSPTGGKDSLRDALNLDPTLKTVLIVGGGDGMGGIEAIATALGEKLGDASETPAYQVVVVCGKNKEAQTRLSGRDWGAGVKVNVQGFVNNMDEWMDASDVLVTKAGPGTIAEASICGLPCMLFAFLAEVLMRDFGIYAQNNSKSIFCQIPLICQMFVANNTDMVAWKNKFTYAPQFCIQSVIGSSEIRKLCMANILE